MPTNQDEDTQMMDAPEPAAPERRTSCSIAEMRRIVCLQIFMGVIANLGSLSPGMSLGYSAIALPQMTSSSNSFQLDADQASWFAGLAAVAMPLGCLLSGPLMDRFGRKTTLLLVNVPCVVGWLLIGSVGQGPGPGLEPGQGPGPGVLAQLYLGRILTGLSTGMTSMPGTIYLAEIAATASMRSTLVTWTSISIAAGILIVYVLGAVFTQSWRLIAYICAIFPLVSFATTFALLPESPVWLISRGRPEPALRALKSLRGGKKAGSASPQTHVQAEFDQMTCKHAKSMKTQTKQTLINNVSFMLTTPEAYKPLLIMNGFFLFQQASGVFVVIFYAVDVAHEAGVTIDGYLATVLIGLMRLLITILVSFISTKCGRRPLSILSGVGMTLSMAFLAACLLWNWGGGGSWVAVVALLAYIAAATIGFLTLPWAMLGEVFPTRIRATASGLTTCLAYTFSFVMIKSYPLMRSAMGSAGVFFFYGAMCGLGTVFVAAFLPETRGRSVEDIAQHFATTTTAAAAAAASGTSGGPDVVPRENELDLPLLESSSNGRRICITPASPPRLHPVGRA